MGEDLPAGEESRPGDLKEQKHGGAIRAPWTSEQARAAQKRSMDARKEGAGSARRLLEERGIEWDKADEHLKLLATNAAKGGASEMRLFLQQFEELKGTNKDKWDGKGPCPTCGQIPGQGLTITADTIEHLHRARRLLKELLEEDADNLFVSSVGTYRARGSGRKDRRSGSGEGA